MTVLGLLNGMIGITALMLPILGITTGYLNTIWVCLGIGLITYYTAYLIVLHLGKAKNMKECILAHFNNDYRYMTIYSCIIWVSFFATILGFFKVACLQITGLMGYYSNWVGPSMAVFMFILVILVRKYHYWEEVLAYGIASIVALLVFIAWAQLSAPSGPKQIPPTGDPFILASVLIQAYSIHGFLAQNILKNPRKNEYQSTTLITFIIGTIAYLYVTFGSFGTLSLIKLS